MLAGYMPLDLEPLCNTGLAGFDSAEEIELGARVLHGLPFRFAGDRAGNCLVDLAAGPVRLPLPAGVRWLIFAHAVLEDGFLASGEVGEALGQYEIAYADGTRHARPIRQRYEIGPSPRKWPGHPIPLDWGHTPFLALPDTEQRLMHRSHGRYDAAGARLVEIEDPQSRVPYVLPYRFFLFAMPNPAPEKAGAELRLRSLGPRIVIGAITAGTLAEDPFGRQVADDIVIELDRPVTEAISIGIDRGTATYLYPALPAPSGPVGGWGEPLAATHRGYARLSGAPSATVRVFDGEDEIAACGFGALLAGEGESGAIRFRRLNRDRTWLEISVTDAETGAPLPCRIHLRTPEGIPCPPYGHHAPVNGGGNTWNLDIGGDVRLGALSYAAIDGRCEGWVPVGDLIVELACGFEYRPRREVVTITPGQRRLALSLARVADCAAAGWHAGDTHLHFLSTQGALHEARAEGVAVANLLLSQWGQLFTSTEEFTGRPVASADGRAVAFAGQENRSNMLGHIHLLGMARPIRPWCTGGAEEAAMGGGLETTLSHWADECHAAGGTVIGAHFPVPNGEIAALIATGRLDAVEMIACEPQYLAEYYRYLNAGYRLPIVGGTDKMTAEVAIGQIRTYVATAAAAGGAPDYGDWLAGIRRGACYVTSGPLLELSVEGTRPGEERRARAGERLTARAEALSIFPLERLELVVNGRIVAEARGDGAERLALEHALALDGASWVAARAFAGPAMRHHHDVWNRPVMAHSSPVYLGCGGPYRRHDAATLRYMRALCEGVRLHIAERAVTRWPGAARQRHGEADHLAFLLRPIDEALGRIAERLDSQS